MAETDLCKCGRSPTRFCVGWHNMTNEEYNKKKAEYEQKSQLSEQKKFLTEINDKHE
jgi:CDGSH-type Zn-finger protein